MDTVTLNMQLLADALDNLFMLRVFWGIMGLSGLVICLTAWWVIRQ